MVPRNRTDATGRMSKTHAKIPKRASAIAFLLLAANCSQLPLTSAVVIPPVPAGTSRIWIYRNEGPHEASDTPYIRLNGQIIGVVQPNGAFYRDVPPGHYSVTVDSYGAPYPNQFAQVDLGAGREAFVEVLSKREKVGGPRGRAPPTLPNSYCLTSLGPPYAPSRFTTAASGENLTLGILFGGPLALRV